MKGLSKEEKDELLNKPVFSSRDVNYVMKEAGEDLIVKVLWIYNKVM